MNLLAIASSVGAVALTFAWCSDHVTDTHDRRNPDWKQSRSIWADHSVPERISGIFSNSCIDCHSNQVNWPLLSRIPLFSSFFENDVYRARKQMNLSEWETLSRGDKEDFQGVLNGVCEETRIREMPPRKYTVMHPGTGISAEESGELCRWAASYQNDQAGAVRAQR